MRTLLLLFVLSVESMPAGQVLTFNTGGALSGNQNDQTIGWIFDVLSPTTVSGLGWYDPSGAGLALAHTVGIWDSGGNLLVSGTVDAGTADPLDGLFRTISITPTTLTPGSGYIVGGQNFFANTDQLAYGVVPATIAEISFAGGVYSDIDGIFELPTFFTADGGDANCCWGPSFLVSADGPATPPPSGAPEPNTMALFASAMVAIAVARRTSRRRRRSRTGAMLPAATGKTRRRGSVTEADGLRSTATCRRNWAARLWPSTGSPRRPCSISAPCAARSSLPTWALPGSASTQCPGRHADQRIPSA